MTMNYNQAKREYDLHACVTDCEHEFQYECTSCGRLVTTAGDKMLSGGWCTDCSSGNKPKITGRDIHAAYQHALGVFSFFESKDWENTSTAAKDRYELMATYLNENIASGKLTTIHAASVCDAMNYGLKHPMTWKDVSYDDKAVARFQGMAAYLDKLVKGAA